MMMHQGNFAIQNPGTGLWLKKRLEHQVCHKLMTSKIHLKTFKWSNCFLLLTQQGQSGRERIAIVTFFLKSNSFSNASRLIPRLWQVLTNIAKSKKQFLNTLCLADI